MTTRSLRTMRSKTARSKLPRELWPPLLVLGIVTGLSGLAAWLAARGTVQPANEQPHVTIVQLGSSLRVGLKDLTPGEIRLFKYSLEHDGSRRILVQRTANDKPRVAFASCRRCDVGDATSYVSGGRLYCRRCKGPMHIPDGSSNRDVKKSACDAVPIQYERRGDEIVVQPSAIEEKAAVFLTESR